MEIIFFEGGNDQRYLESVIVCVDDGKGEMVLVVWNVSYSRYISLSLPFFYPSVVISSKLLRQCQKIFVLPASNLKHFPRPKNVISGISLLIYIKFSIRSCLTGLPVNLQLWAAYQKTNKARPKKAQNRG